MTEDIETGTASGIERRDFIKKSAIVGGLVWAAPAMSALGPRAFGQENNGTPRCKTAISNIAIVFTVEGVTYQAKYDLDDKCEDQGTAVPGCVDPTGWQDPRTSNKDGCHLVTWNTDDECCWKATIGGTGTISIVGVAVGGGGDLSPDGVGECIPNFTQTNGDRTYQWCAT